ncbi:MAG TPA: cation-transporting P-type ATPase [Anaerolineaceae bacterium]|nr:cation-transporting P-type ATPase [Anaerolineaceae bacterium]
MSNSESNKEGLTTQQAQALLQKYGPNEIYKEEKISVWGIFLEELQEPMMILLFVTGILYSIFGNLGDAITIFAVIILLVMSEVVTEYRAQKSIASLSQIAALKARVKRDGQIVEINTLDVVPGDLLVLTTGTKIAADAVVEHAINLELDESELTGESEAVDKEKGGALYAGTIVTSGEGQATVTVTGPATRLGKIAAESKEIETPKTPMQQAMSSLSVKLAYVAIFFSIGIPLLGYIRGQDWRLMITTGLALAFAVIPEELPIVINMVLGLGSYNLSKKNLLIKKLRAAESMANTTVIVTDKTGTITEGKMKIVSTYPDNPTEVLWKAELCLSEFARTPLDLEIIRKSKESQKSLAQSPTLPEIIRERDLGNGQKTKAILRKKDDVFMLCKSGAPEEVFASCKDVPDDVMAELERQTKAGRRVIAVAYKELLPGELDLGFAEIEKDMTFVGLVCFEDSPRAGVKDTIAQVARAGIRTIMVTGDHPATAESIARQVGIVTQKVVTGTELDGLSDQQLQETVKQVAVFARTTPEHKYRIVKALQANHEIVAVTGDGINDVLALKGADIGIAMGIRGTDVAREAADVVLADDNYNTIALGIFEGRGLFDNLQKGMRYYLSIKLALILIFLVPVLLNVPMPFSPIQIIILELFMDLAASAGFVAEPKEKDVYTRKPRDPQQPIFNSSVIADLVMKSLVLFITVTAIFLFTYSRSSNTAYAQTMAFASWIIGHITLAYVSRSDKQTLRSIGVFTNPVINVWALAAVSFLLIAIYVPVVNNLIRMATVPFPQLLLVMLVTMLAVLLLEIKKLPVFNRSSELPDQSVGNA